MQVNLSETEKILSMAPSMLVSATYDNTSRSAILKFYNPESKKLILWKDEIGHKPYCYSKLDLDELDFLQDREDVIKIERVKRHDLIKDENIDVSKIIVEEYNDLLEQLHGSFSELHDRAKKMAESERRRGKNIDRYDLFMNALKEMALLEASMQRVAKNGRETLRRIVQVTEND